MTTFQNILIVVLWVMIIIFAIASFYIMWKEHKRHNRKNICVSFFKDGIRPNSVIVIINPLVPPEIAEEIYKIYDVLTKNISKENKKVEIMAYEDYKNFKR